MRILIAFVLLVSGACAVAATEHAPLRLPPHPRLLFNREGVGKLRERANRLDWASTHWNEVKTRCDKLLTEKIEFPPRGGNWYHWYACPKHAVALKTGKKIGKWKWEHTCPVDGEVFTSDPKTPSKDYDGCAIAWVHDKLAHNVLDLGIAYQITKETRYAAKAREILLGYATQYLTYPLHDIHGEAKIGGGRVDCQTLDESVWLIPICQGTDLIWDTLSEADRAAITDKILIPAAKEVILPHKMGIHNIQCWKNSAVGLVGFLTDNQELIRDAIYDPDQGYLAQMSKGVTPDGMWHEGAWGYHFYTLSAIWPLVEAANNCGLDLYNESLKNMFDAPLNFASPTLTLPDFNDSPSIDMQKGEPLYELAYARYRKPGYLALIGRDRSNDYALWFGVVPLPKAPPRMRFSENYPKSGYAILTTGHGEQATWLCLKYGPHGGGHGHPDKLAFVLSACGVDIAVDPGTVHYGLPIDSGWYRTSLAHNTLIVDETSQKESTGGCIAFGTTNGVDYTVDDAGPIYDGVRFTRTAAMLDQNHIVFIDQVAGDREHQLDIAYHQRGVWEDLPEGTSWTPPDKPGYKYLLDATSRQAGKQMDLATSLPGIGSVVVSLAGNQPSQVITATGAGTQVNDRVPVAMFRRTAKDTAFVWAVSLDGKPLHLDVLNVDKDVPASAATAVRVTLASGKTYDVLTNAEKRSVTVLMPDGSKWNSQADFAVR